MMTTPKKTHFYIFSANSIFLEGIENLIKTKISDEAIIDRQENIQALIENKKINTESVTQVLIYEVVDYQDKDFNDFLKLLDQYPDLKILMINASVKVKDIRLLFQMGVCGIINNAISSISFVDYVQSIMEGGKVLSPEYRDLVIEYFFQTVVNKEPVWAHNKININKDMLWCAELTDREKEILRSICEGKSTFEISQDLFLSPHTVETHRRKILYKLGVKNTASMVRVAVENGLCAS